METEEILAAIQKAADTIATPNWAAKASVVISFLAIIVAAGVAIYVAKKQNEIAEEQTKISQKQADISDKQNKIALFEKRYATFREISNVLSLGEDFEYFSSCTLYEYFIGVLLTLNYPEPQTKSPNTFVYHFKVDYTISLIKQSTFLFPDMQKDDVDELSKKFRHFFVSVETDMRNDRQKNIGEYCKANTSMSDFFRVSKDFSNKYLNTMEKYLSFERY